MKHRRAPAEISDGDFKKLLNQNTYNREALVRALLEHPTKADKACDARARELWEREFPPQMQSRRR